MIGEAFENSDDVCGAVVNIRGKGDKIGKCLNDNFIEETLYWIKITTYILLF